MKRTFLTSVNYLLSSNGRPAGSSLRRGDILTIFLTLWRLECLLSSIVKRQLRLRFVFRRVPLLIRLPLLRYDCTDTRESVSLSWALPSEFDVTPSFIIDWWFRWRVLDELARLFNSRLLCCWCYFLRLSMGSDWRSRFWVIVFAYLEKV